MALELTRRGALGAAALAVASCSGGDDPPPGGPGPGSGAGVLGSVLAFEHAVTAAYGYCEGVLRGEALRFVRLIRDEERRHAEHLAGLIRELGGEPPTGRRSEDYERSFPRLRSAADALRFAEDLEERQVRACLDALTDLPDPDLRSAVAEIGASEGAHLAVVHLLRGEPASPDPFVTGAL